MNVFNSSLNNLLLKNSVKHPFRGEKRRLVVVQIANISTITPGLIFLTKFMIEWNSLNSSSFVCSQSSFTVIFTQIIVFAETAWMSSNFITDHRPEEPNERTSLMSRHPSNTRSVQQENEMDDDLPAGSPARLLTAYDGQAGSATTDGYAGAMNENEVVRIKGMCLEIEWSWTAVISVTYTDTGLYWNLIGL